MRLDGAAAQVAEIGVSRRESWVGPGEAIHFPRAYASYSFNVLK